MLQHLRPQYAKQFRCIGGECEDTCCHGLDVVVDRTAYERLQSLPGFQASVSEHFVIIDSSRTDSRHARIRATASFTCPFLSSSRLCTIQQEHGELYLPDVCAKYPRITQRIDGLSETALLLSCPEAARLVLLNPHLLSTEEGDFPRYHRFARMAAQPMRANGSPHQYLWDIRGFTLLLLRDRAYPLWQRLFMLGLFCQRLHKLTADGQLGLVPRLLNEHAEVVTHGGLRSAMESVPVRTAQQLEIIIALVKRQLEMTDASHVRFRECVRDFLEGVRYLPGTPVESCAPFYEAANARYFGPFMDKHPHILENYLVNHVFRTRFPYGVDSHGRLNDPLTEYMVMCVLYAIVKSVLVGMAAHYEAAFAETHVVKLIQSFAKAVEHCPTFLDTANLKLVTADGMALLLKNEC